MRPGGDLLGQRPRRDIEIAPPGVPTNHATPTSFFIASEHMLENESPEDVGDVSESTFGVESLQETVFSERLKDDGGKNDREGRNNNKHENRRRSTLKPATYDQDSCTETNKSTSQHRVNDGSPSDTNFLRTSPPSVSESLTSLSQASQLQGISPPGSPKSNSTRSFRHSDEESTDETGSQAIVSSGEDDNEYPSEIIDSSPQLIMPSIKMPSRRPFTDRGKCIGRLKILIAGDSGKYSRHLASRFFAKRCRSWQDISH